MQAKALALAPPFNSSTRCPLEQYLDVISGAWTPRIIWCLLERPTYRFADLERALTGISPKVLTRKLRDLERHRFVQRKLVNSSRTPHVEYVLTERGRALEPVFRAMEVTATQLFADTSE